MKPRVQRHEVVQPPDPSYRLIPLTQEQNAIVDTEDYDWLLQWNWYAMRSLGTKSFYAIRNIVGNWKTHIFLHEAVMGFEFDREIDHQNHDTLDNRKYNLRHCTQQQNIHNRRLQNNNTSGFKGVSWHSLTQMWKGCISLDSKWIHLGMFTTAEEAAHAYDEAAIRLHGEFAHLNFPLATEKRPEQ
jgi:hypothetical protein